MICAHCQNAISKDLQAACGLSVCIVCATAISNALAELPNKPARRQEITMLLQKLNIQVSPADKRIGELIEYGETDYRIRAAVDILKSSCPKPGIGLICWKLREERANGRPAEQPKPEAEAVSAKPLWQLQGFVSEADYEKCDAAFTQHKFKAGARCQTWKQFKEAWLAEAV